MNAAVIKTAKIIGKGLVTFGLPLVSAYFSNKELDEKVAKAVNEAMANVKKD